MTSFVLKIIALISMLCDHFGDAFMKQYSFLNLIGRVSFPIFAFQISQGYIHTSNKKKYFFRLLIFALISQIPFYLFLQKFLPTSTTKLNIFFTLLLGLSCIIIYNFFEKVENKELNYTLFGVEIKKIIGILSSFCIAYIGELLHVDYGFWGIIVILSFYLLRDNKIAMYSSYITLCIIRYVYRIIFYGFNIRYIYLCFCTIVPIFLIALYNGKQGYKIKYLLYIFYPLHLLLLYLFL